MKEKLLETALSLFRENGYQKVSIQKICEACQVTKGCFYHYYHSKEDLLLDYYELIPQENLVQILSEMMGIASPLKRLWMYFGFYIEHSTQLGPDLLKELMKIDMDRGGVLFTPYYNTQQGAVPGFLKVVETLTREGQAEGNILSNASWEKLLWIYTASFTGALMYWSSSGGAFDVKEELHCSFLHIYQGVEANSDSCKFIPAQNS